MLNAVTLAYLTSLILPTSGGVCGKASMLVGDIRVVGGDAVADSVLYPWFVAFLIPESVIGDRPPVVACGGSLITSSHVLTAAHCYIRNRTRGDLTASYKLAYLLKDKCQDRKDLILEPQARSVRLHERFSPTTLRNDIALVTLQRKVAYTPICLPTMRAETSYAAIIGFGSVLPRAVYPCRLQEATVTIYSRAQCLSLAVGKLIQTLPNVLCAGKLQGGVDTCDGDSGGPLQYINGEGNYVISGIVSFGNGCGKVGYPGVYTDVTQYLNWIEAIVGRGNVPSVGRRPSFWEMFSRPQTNWSAWFNALVSHINNVQKCQNVL